MNIQPRITLALLCGFAALLLPATAGAQIALHDGSTVISETTGQTGTETSVVVTTGANVLVVAVMDKGGTAAGAEPASLAWGSQTIQQAVTEPDTSGTFRDLTIYYLYNPAVGTNTITAACGTGVTAVEMQAYTLSGVNTGVAPLVNAVNSPSTQSISAPVGGVTTGSWAAVNGVYCGTGAIALTAPGTGGTVTANYDTTDAGTAEGMGYVSAITSGSTFTASSTSAVNKMVIVAAVFSPPLANAPATVTENPTPASASAFPTSAVTFAAAGEGSLPLTNLWLFGNSPLSDGAKPDGSVIVGSQTSSLTISNITPAEGGDYYFTISNGFGGNISAAAVLTVTAFLAPQNIQLDMFEGIGQDWNTAAAWSDDLSASTSAFDAPGSTYEVLAGAQLRTPIVPTGADFTNFPGVQLTVDGNGVWTNNPAAGTAQGQIRFKGEANPATYPITNYFPLLIMAGGQLDNAGPGVTGACAIDIQGAMDVTANTPFYVDTSGSENRQFIIDAYLEGSGSIEYHDFDASLTGGLIITCPTNSYSGAWNIVQGPLVGSGANSLGTNSITIGTNAALETLYNVYNPAGTLALNGKMFLHQDDTFYQVAVGNTGLAAGSYTYPQLAAAFPASFPATWTSLYGSTYSSASGSITVLSSLILPPFIISQPPANAEEYSGASLTYSIVTGGSAAVYQWYANGVPVHNATNAAYTFASDVGASTYYCLVSNAAGIATSLVVTNTGTTPPVTVTFSDTPNWTLQGVGVTPTLTGDVLTLTTNGVSEAASAFYDIAQYIEGFEATFTYTPGGSLQADGVTFCIQNASAGPTSLGLGGGDLGYTGISNSVAFELNIYTAAAAGGAGINFGANGQVPSGYHAVTPVNLDSGDPIKVNLYYSQGVAQVTLTDLNNASTFSTNATVGDFGALVGESVGYIGFTGADGGLASTQTISDFSFIPVAVPVLSISKSGSGTITVSWSGGVITNLLLQESPTLAGPWNDVGISPTVVGSQYQVVRTTGTGPMFYRLGLH